MNTFFDEEMMEKYYSEIPGGKDSAQCVAIDDDGLCVNCITEDSTGKLIVHTGLIDEVGVFRMMPKNTNPLRIF